MQSFKNKRVLIFGLGLNQGGLGSANFFASQGAKVKVTDLRSREVLKESIDQLKKYPNIKYSLDRHKYEDIDWADLIIKNPAVKPGNPYIEYAAKLGKQVETDIGLFLHFVKPQQIIGITGTKGKSTTASLIYEILKKAGKKVVLSGNIGTSVLNTLADIKNNTLVVLEISSFQLEAFDLNKVSPKWAVITNIHPDHLNYYSSMEEYINSKKIIGKYQTKSGLLFISKDNAILDRKDFLSTFKGKIIRFSKKDLPKDLKPYLIGEHNLENIAAALEVGKILDINEEDLIQTIEDFQGVPFRMELIKQWRGVKIYNDTAATTPDAGIKALQTLPNCILIAGGMNKNMSYEEYTNTVDKYAKQVFFLEGDSTEEIKRSMKNKEKIAGTYDNLEKLLLDIKPTVQSGDVILFSPSATSFNLFQNEFDRGRKFNEAVQKIFS